MIKSNDSDPHRHQPETYQLSRTAKRVKKIGGKALAIVLATGVGVGIGVASRENSEWQAYDRAVASAVEQHKALTPNDFIYLGEMQFTPGEAVDADGFPGGPTVPAVRIEASMKPGDLVQSKLFSDEGMDVGRKRLERVIGTFVELFSPLSLCY